MQKSLRHLTGRIRSASPPPFHCGGLLFFLFVAQFPAAGPCVPGFFAACRPAAGDRSVHSPSTTSRRAGSQSPNRASPRCPTSPTVIKPAAPGAANSSKRASKNSCLGNKYRLKQVKNSICGRSDEPRSAPEISAQRRRPRRTTKKRLAGRNAVESGLKRNKNPPKPDRCTPPAAGRQKLMSAKTASSQCKPASRQLVNKSNRLRERRESRQSPPCKPASRQLVNRSNRLRERRESRQTQRAE